MMDPSITETETIPETETPPESETPTLTETPTETVEVTETPTLALTQTPSGTPGVALYYYDGNGSMVKSIIGDVVTYYPNDGYQVKSDGTNGNTRKYYSFGNATAGGATVAMRENDIVVWLMSDQVNSTTVTASEDGTLTSEIKYTAFGEMRMVNGVLVTDNRYTGQREEVEIGLYYYGARFYDPYLNRWIQPDPIVPDPYNSQNWDRFSYVGNNPIRYTDPTGHMRTEEDSYYKGSTGNANPELIWKAILQGKYPNVTLLGDVTYNELKTISLALKLTYMEHGSNIESYTRAVGNITLINTPFGSRGMAPPFANIITFPDMSFLRSSALYDLVHEIGHREDFNGSGGDPNLYKSQLFVDVFANGCNVGRVGCLGSRPDSIYKTYNFLTGGSVGQLYQVSGNETTAYGIQQGSIDDYADTYANVVLTDQGYGSKIPSYSSVKDHARRIIIAVWVDLLK